MIEFENIVIRTIAEGDIDKLFLWNTCEFRGEFQEFTFESKQSIRKNFEEDGFCTDTFMMLMIEEDSIPVGLVYINFIRFGIARIGLVICSDRRGKGYECKTSFT